ncbi:putative ATP-grasp-modified RiPP [Streptomyces sp. MN13]
MPGPCAGAHGWRTAGAHSVAAERRARHRPAGAESRRTGGRRVMEMGKHGMSKTTGTASVSVSVSGGGDGQSPQPQTQTQTQT